MTYEEIGKCLNCGKAVSNMENVIATTKYGVRTFCSVKCQVAYKETGWREKIWFVGKNDMVMGYSAIVPYNNSYFTVRLKYGKTITGVCIIPYSVDFLIISVAYLHVIKINYNDVESITTGD